MSDDVINRLKAEKDFLRETLNAHIFDLCALTDMLQKERDEALAKVEHLRAALALAVGEMSTHGEYSYLSPDTLMDKFLEEARRD